LGTAETIPPSPRDRHLEHETCGFLGRLNAACCQKLLNSSWRRAAPLRSQAPVTAPSALSSQRRPKNKTIKLCEDTVKRIRQRPVPDAASPRGEVPSAEDKTYVPSSEKSGRLTRQNFSAGWKPNLCRPATGSVGVISAAGARRRTCACTSSQRCFVQQWRLRGSFHTLRLRRR
jgi:hypothetical protein